MSFLRNSRSPKLSGIFPFFSFVIVMSMASAVVAMTAPSQAQADDSQGFSSAPAYEDGSDPARTRFSYGADPGQSIADTLYISNTGTVPQEITVQATDGFNSEDGSLSLLDNTVDPTDVGSWVSFDGSPVQIITLAPLTSKVVPFTVNVPAEARPGDHVGGLVTSVVSPDGQVKLERRVATRLYVRVSGDLQPALTVSGLTSVYMPDLNPFNGSVFLTYTVKNSGNVVLKANTVASVSGLFGSALSGETTAEMPELLPDGSLVMTTVVPGVWQWLWMNSQVSLTATVDEGTRLPGVLPRATREASTWAVPWALLILLMAAGFVYFYFRFSRMNNERRSQQWIEYTEAEARLRAREESPES
jgi:hypothetical protein